MRSIFLVNNMEQLYAIIENSLVANITTATPEFAESQGWVLLTDGAAIGWSYIGGVFFPPPPKDYSEQNKETGKGLLQQTDWAATVDITDPQYSNPYLGNQDAFLEYRSQVRAIVVNPPTDFYAFPEKPVAVWIDVPAA